MPLAQHSYKVDEWGTKPRKGIDATYLVAGLSAGKFWTGAGSLGGNPGWASHPQVHRLVLLGLKCCPSQVLTCPETTGVTVLGMELNPSSLQPRAPPPPRPWLLTHAPLSSSSKFFQVTVFSGISERKC